MDAEPFDCRRYLDAFVKAAQYLSGLTRTSDVWAEAAAVIINFFGAAFAAFAQRLDGETVLRGEPAGVPADAILRSCEEVISQVLESGFAATETVDLPSPHHVAFLPVNIGNRTVAVMLVGHTEAAPLHREVLNLYLAAAGLISVALHKSASEEELRRLNEALEQRVKDRTRELEKKNAELKRINRLFVGRELRMIELKERIRNLEKDLP